jgi:glycine cleavage system H protein
MRTPANLRYSEEHEWVLLEQNVATIGITDFAQSELGDVVFVELPAVGSTVSAGKPLGVVESVKAVSDVYAPVTGTVREVNEKLTPNPELVNSDPYGDGWMIRVEVTAGSEVDALMDAEQYAQFVGKEKA